MLATRHASTTHLNRSATSLLSVTRISPRPTGKVPMRTGLLCAPAGARDLPVNKANRIRYSNATTVLEEINNNLSEVY